jgi:hypothetical protein
MMALPRLLGPERRGDARELRARAFFALFGTIFFLTQFLQEVRGYSALGAGLRTLPVAAGLVIGGPLSAKLTERLGLRAVVPAGLAAMPSASARLSPRGRLPSRPTRESGRSRPGAGRPG